MTSPSPSTKSLVSGYMSSAADERRRHANQVALEKAGHSHAIPMTSQGLAQLQMLRDVVRRTMTDRGIPLSTRDEVLRADPSLTLKGWAAQAQGEVRAIQLSVREALIQRQEYEMEARRLREHPGA